MWLVGGVNIRYFVWGRIVLCSDRVICVSVRATNVSVFYSSSVGLDDDSV